MESTFIINMNKRHMGEPKQDDDQQPQQPRRKRNRISLTCINCKKRKIKCDRGKPCTACSKYGSICEYPDMIWSSQSSTMTQNGASFGVHSFPQVSPQPQQPQPPPQQQQQQKQVVTELSFLKNKIKEIEKSLGSRSADMSSEDGSVSGSGSVTSEGPIRLPPIRKLAFNWNEYKYDPDNNPTYVGINLYANDEETINFYDDYTPIHMQDEVRRHNYGPLAWFSILKKDPGLRMLWDHLQSGWAQPHGDECPMAVENAKLAAACRPGTISPPDTAATHAEAAAAGVCHMNSLDETFREKSLERDGQKDIRLYGNVREVNKLREESTPARALKPCDMKSLQRVEMNKNALTLGLTFYEGKIDRYMELIEKISLILPPRKVIWTLIDKFFQSVYPYMPFIDEGYFKAEILRVLGPEDSNNNNNDRKSSIKVERRLDFAYIGTLLIVLRLTYLSLFSNNPNVNEHNLNTSDPSPQAQELKYLLSNPINIDVINIARLCLDQFEINRKSNFVVLQCAFYMRLYRMFAPEDGDGADGGDSQVFNGMLVQMAISMGLNREPDNFDGVCKNERMKNLGRKIWLFLIINDLVQSYQYGNPMNISEKMYDTKLPYYKPGNENVEDVEMEKHVVSTFAYFEKYYHKLTVLLDRTLDIRERVTMKELTRLITDFEIYLNDHYGLLKFFLVPFKQDNYSYPFIKVMKCKNYINMKMFLNNIFFQLYLYYERKQNLEFAYFYLRKLLANLCGEFIPSVMRLISDNYVNFGPVADLILNPSLLAAIHKTSQFCFAILIRLNSTTYKMRYVDPMAHEANLRRGPEYAKRYLKLVKLSKLFARIAKYSVASITKLSQRYYYAWRIGKAHGYVLSTILGTDFYAKSANNPVLFLDLNEDQINEITTIADALVRQFPGGTSVKKEYNLSQILNDVEDQTIPTPTPLPQQLPIPGNRVVGSASPSLSTILGDTSKTNNNVTDPSTVDSQSGESEDFGFLQNAEIDNLWKQMAEQMKNQEQQQSQIPSNNGGGGVTGGDIGGATGQVDNELLLNYYPVTPSSFPSANSIPSTGTGVNQAWLNGLSLEELMGFSKW
ncbi:uncharacterized protein J8A68_002926 [[Candida] subhashii]|uniref:Zn(2)-C6 fungal-type domain-containing protein n=1 Tax=[Candida] subhashii TaxID=561895 RepID=A0A8J5UNA5_9ASCO|nr:uncharacterized protein J8A68_002926 [[Candida] subhashii]KAG7663542.1 hypothetical protein J8A68_002926 [[Candida] subhashii]